MMQALESKILPAEHVVEGIARLQGHFLATDPVVKASKVSRVNPSEFSGVLKKHLSVGGALPAWVRQMPRGENFTHLSLTAEQTAALNATPRTRVELELLTEIFNYCGRLLRMGGALCSTATPKGAIDFHLPADAAAARLILAGHSLVEGAHPVVPVPLPIQPTIQQLRDMVANNEWPILIDTSKADFSIQESVHGLEHAPAYVALWHDIYHWLRQARWPQKNRELLPVLYDLTLDPRLPQVPFIDDLRLSILSGPDPFHYNRTHGASKNKFGFYGALFFMMAGQGIGKNFGTKPTDDFLHRYYNLVRKYFLATGEYNEVSYQWSQTIGARQLSSGQRDTHDGLTISDPDDD